MFAGFAVVALFFLSVSAANNYYCVLLYPRNERRTSETFLFLFPTVCLSKQLTKKTKTELVRVPSDEGVRIRPSSVVLAYRLPYNTYECSRLIHHPVSRTSMEYHQIVFLQGSFLRYWCIILGFLQIFILVSTV